MFFSHAKWTHDIFIDWVEGSSFNLVWRKTLSKSYFLTHEIFIDWLEYGGGEYLMYHLRDYAIT
jgi:hypothetical protein